MTDVFSCANRHGVPILIVDPAFQALCQLLRRWLPEFRLCAPSNFLLIDPLFGIYSSRLGSVQSFCLGLSYSVCFIDLGKGQGVRHERVIEMEVPAMQYVRENCDINARSAVCYSSFVMKLNDMDAIHIIN